jgi:hypothetical protein
MVGPSLDCSHLYTGDEENQITYKYMKAAIGHIVARSLKGGVEGAQAGIDAMSQLMNGLDATEMTWKLDDQTHPYGKLQLRQLVINAIRFLELNFGLNYYHNSTGVVPVNQYIYDGTFGIYEALDFIKVAEGETEDEDEEELDEADWE